MDFPMENVLASQRQVQTFEQSTAPFTRLPVTALPVIDAFSVALTEIICFSVFMCFMEVSAP